MTISREQMMEMLQHGNRADAQKKQEGKNAPANTENLSAKIGEQMAMPGMPNWQNVGKNKPTEKMIAGIKKIAGLKGVEIDTARMQTFEDARAYMDELYKLPFAQTETRVPLSQKQRDKIEELCNECNVPLPDFSTLEGGFNKSGSQFIQKLLQMRTENKISGNAPLPSVKQIEEIVRYQLCPDVCAHNANGKALTEKDAEKMTKQQAYQYIAEHRNEYYAWIKTRASIEQINRIEQLNKMMGCPEMSYEVLIQFDTNQASAYITQLESEYNRKDWNETSLEAEDDYLNDDVRHRHHPENVEQKALDDWKTMLIRLYMECNMEFEEDAMHTDDPVATAKELAELAVFYANAKTVINIVNDNESLSEELKDEILADILPLA